MRRSNKYGSRRPTLVRTGVSSEYVNRVESFCDTMMIADMVKHLFFDDYNTYQLKQRELIELGGKVVANGRDDSESWVDVRVDNIVYKLVFYIK